MRRSARFTEVELRRTLRAAKALGDEVTVRILPDGSFEISLKSTDGGTALAQKRFWVT